MTALGQVLIVISVLAGGIIYGTDVFSAIVLRPALALVDDRTLVSAMGRVHDFGDRSAPVNARLTAASQRGELPPDARLLQQRWDSVITARSGLQMVAILALCTVLITS
jgi:hypothetical protein